MYKATARDVKRLIEWGKDDGVVAGLMADQAQPPTHDIAYFAPSAANWAWRIGLIHIHGRTYELLTRFGVVEGGRQIHLVDY
jgi:hypothetical protein